MAQDFGDDMGNALLNFVTRQTENYLRFGRGRERAFDWWQRHYKKEGNTPEQAKAMAEKQSSREQKLAVIIDVLRFPGGDTAQLSQVRLIGVDAACRKFLLDTGCRRGERHAHRPRKYPGGCQGASRCTQEENGKNGACR